MFRTLCLVNYKQRNNQTNTQTLLQTCETREEHSGDKNTPQLWERWKHNGPRQLLSWL